MITTEIARRLIADSSIDLVYAECAAHRFRPHLHAELALGVIGSGRHQLRCASGTHIVGPGDIVVVNPREIHTGESLDGLPWSYSMFYIPDRLVQDLGPAPSGGWERTLRFPTALVRDPPFARRLAVLHEELRSRSDSEPHARFTVALREFISRHAVSRVQPPASRKQKPHENARQYLEQHYAERIKLPELSRVVGVSVFRLVHAFTQAFGMPPASYLRQLRIAHAQSLLRSGRPVAEVARAMAFSDQSHFTRRFKETLGYPPGAYLRAVLSSAASWAYRDPTR